MKMADENSTDDDGDMRAELWLLLTDAMIEREYGRNREALALLDRAAALFNAATGTVPIAKRGRGRPKLKTGEDGPDALALKIMQRLDGGSAKWRAETVLAMLPGASPTIQRLLPTPVKARPKITINELVKSEHRKNIRRLARKFKALAATK